MKIGLQIPDFTTPGGPARLGADLATVARTADDAGFDFIAVMDHFFQIGPIGRHSHPRPRGPLLFYVERLVQPQQPAANRRKA